MASTLSASSGARQWFAWQWSERSASDPIKGSGCIACDIADAIRVLSPFSRPLQYYHTSMAYCSASKHALEGYSESLDHEVREFGVRVAVIEPGTTRTSFDSATAPADKPVAAYDASRASYLVAYNKAMAAADTPESVAQTIVAAASDKSPRLRYPSGKVARQGAFARRFLPRSLFDKILHAQFGLG